MIYFIHGLFSGPEIWNPYIEGDYRKAISLYSDDPFKIQLTSSDILVGYSLGGRIAMELASRQNFSMKKIILLAAHPGLCDEEKKERKIWEDELLKKMENSSILEFLEYWNSLPLFSQSKLLSLTQERFQQGKKIFDRYRLSQQENFLSLLKKHHQKVIYIHGKEDAKYAQLAKMLKDQQVKIKAINGDHRVYLNHTELYPILEESYS
jgi:2-succinyl-6-hydroxy-2,4-cyclohexadiene-1-carboxylate synthase